MKRIVLAILCAAASAAVVGCSTTAEALRGKSVSFVGCPESEITVRDNKMTSAGSEVTWVAECRGQVYYCRADGFGAHPHCTKAQQ